MSIQSTIKEKLKYPSLNGLRAISLVFVILIHEQVNRHIFDNINQNKFLYIVTNFLCTGLLGVHIFFVISGFLITSLLLQEERKNQTVSLKNFYIRRTLRIFPAYYFMLLVYFMLQCLGYINIEKQSWITALTYTKYFNWSLEWFTAHLWSLSIEEQFYLFWPLVFVFAPRYRKLIAIIIIPLVPGIRILQHFYPINNLNDHTLLFSVDSLAVGCLCALYTDEILNIVKNHWGKLFYISLSLLAILHVLSINKTLNANLFFITFGFTCGPIANFLISAIMMYSIFGPQKQWFKFLNLRFINYIGLLSYSLYLWQQIFTSEVTWWVAAFPQNLLSIVLAALVSYYIIETPFLKLKDKFSAMKK